MQYLYHPDAAERHLELTGDNHRYLFKVRRHRAGEYVHLRNLNDVILYTYRIDSMDKKSAQLSLEAQEPLIIMAAKKLHLGWCVIDPKNIEKILPALNEIGVDKITFIYAQRSQKSFKLDFKRMKKILLNSSQQCGRSVMMALDEVTSLEAFISQYPDANILHFSENRFDPQHIATPVVIGPEGGFTEAEIALFAPAQIQGLGTPLVLRSESAVMAVSSQVLL